MDGPIYLGIGSTVRRPEKMIGNKNKTKQKASLSGNQRRRV
jgi:hypothetical protein